MKKLLCLMLAVMTLCTLTACGEKEITAYEPAVKESAVQTTGEEVWNIAYVYDADGLLIKEINTAADGTGVNNYYIYNDDGNCTSEVHNNVDGTKDKYRHTWKDGLKTKTVYTEPTGTKHTFVYTHNEDGTIAGYTLTFATKEVQEAVYTYNALGAVEKIEKTGHMPSVTVYAYNNHGDVITETVTVDGTETVTTNEYTYQK